MANSKISSRADKLSRRYNLSIADYDALLLSQAGVCAICGGKDERQRLSVDHNHATKSVRGLLCGNCNNGLGRFKDSIELLLAAVNYLHHRDK